MEADFFYVPVYTNLLINPVVGWTDGPMYYGENQHRIVHATGMLDEAQHWIQSHYPYWDRKGGRDHIWFFSDRYSKRTRQRIAKRAWEEDWEHKHRILIVDNTNKTEKSYSELMASSIFCLAIIGDGWTTRVEDAMVHGCIPVLFMDNVVPVFGNIIKEEDVYGEFGL
ncbi:hypothetical protein QBZ16_000744 [Prototheca wickerhamii]|uniref:Exostosin GT47 domain-containing protein n=1 Tax=Prototheca wickerhamii TaxID=3111 RepID=A0AAD9INL8_PROWI|nr:hypothetical protein QBZ16_000744 [Prototheca wickerhamii]